MADEFHAYVDYLRLQRGEPEDQEFESGMTEDEILAEADALGDTPIAAPADEAWVEVDPAELLKELDALGEEHANGE